MKRLLTILLIFTSLSIFGQGNIKPNFAEVLQKFNISSYGGVNAQFWWNNLQMKRDSLGYHETLNDSIRFRYPASPIWSPWYKNINTNLFKLRNDSVTLPGFLTNWKALQYRKLNNHDSLANLDERSYNSLTDKPTIPSAQVNSDWNSVSGVSQILNKPDLSIYRLLNNHDSLSNLDEKNYSSLIGKPDLSIYRTFVNHDSLMNLDERSYNSLTDKPNLSLYRLLTNHDSLSSLDERSYNSLTDKPTYTNIDPGTVDGQIPYWDNINGKYIPSSSGKLNWNDVSSLLGLGSLDVNGSSFPTRLYGGTTGSALYSLSLLRSAASKETDLNFRRPDVFGTGRQLDGTPSAKGYQLVLGRSPFLTDIIIGDGTYTGGTSDDTGTGLSNAYIRFPNYGAGILKTNSIGVISVDTAIGDTITKVGTKYDLSLKEDKSNKVTIISSGSTDVQYPSAKLVWNQNVLKVDKISGQSLIRSAAIDSIHTSIQVKDSLLYLKGNYVPHSQLITGLSTKLNLTGGTLSNILYFSNDNTTARILPTNNNTGYVGDNTHRWAGIFSGIGSFSGTVTANAVTSSAFLSNSEIDFTTLAYDDYQNIKVKNGIFTAGITAVAGSFSGKVTANAFSSSAYLSNSLIEFFTVPYDDYQSIKAKNATFTGAFSGTAGGFTGALTASSFAVPGGLSTQYLMRDGSYSTTAGSVYKGQVDGSTGSGIADGTGTTGWYYACSVAGTHNYGSGNITLAIGDQLYYNGSVWLKIPGAGSYSLPIATSSVLGGFKTSSSVFIDGTGVATVSTAYRGSTWVPAWSDVTSKPTTLSTIATNDLTGINGISLGVLSGAIRTIKATGTDLRIVSGDGNNYMTMGYSGGLDYNGYTIWHSGNLTPANYVPITTTVNGHALSSNVTVTPTDLSLVIGTNVQAYNSNLTGINQGLTTTSSPSFTAVGATTFTGTLTGHASLDALTNQTMYIGITSVAINRASAALVLTGITSIDGSSASCTGNAATVTNGVYTGDSRLTDARTPTSHTHGNITNTGYLGTTATLPLITGAGGIIQAGAFGATSGTFTQGNDSRLSNNTVQALSGTTITWDLSAGRDATLTLTGNTTITLSNGTAGLSGNIKVTNDASSAYTLTFSTTNYTNAIQNPIRAAANQVTTSGGSSKKDIYSYWITGTVANWNGGLNFN
jgi:hypothetical protein